jgi:hypothetical protein
MSPIGKVLPSSIYRGEDTIVNNYFEEKYLASVSKGLEMDYCFVFNALYASTGLLSRCQMQTPSGSGHGQYERLSTETLDTPCIMRTESESPAHRRVFRFKWTSGCTEGYKYT